nr:YopX family protein [uncultured Cellulosilyticum sp.]
MREIKFRAWDKSQNKMYQVRGINFDNEDLWLKINETQIMGANLFEVELMQYTGLKDKNGTEIYEGDIIEDCEGKKKKVIWHNNGFKLQYKYKKSYQGEIYWSTNKDIELNGTSDKRWGVEVIGNIFENLELLKEGE